MSLRSASCQLLLQTGRTRRVNGAKRTFVYEERERTRTRPSPGRSRKERRGDRSGTHTGSSGGQRGFVFGKLLKWSFAVLESHSDRRTCSCRPSQQVVPASERYAASVQKNRQERRLRRQAELLALQGSSRPSRTSGAPRQEPQLCSTVAQGRTAPTRKVGARFAHETEYLAQFEAFNEPGTPGG